LLVAPFNDLARSRAFFARAIGDEIARHHRREAGSSACSRRSRASLPAWPAHEEYGIPADLRRGRDRLPPIAYGGARNITASLREF